MKAHAAEGRAVQPAVIGDETEHAFAGALDPPLRETDEFDVIVVQPFRVLFAQRFAIHMKITAGPVRPVPTSQQSDDPCAPVGGMAGIGRIAEHHHHRLLALHRVGARGFARDLMGEQRAGV